MDRSWISTSKPGDPEYIAGEKEFIDFAVKNSRGRTRLPCPCFKCHNFLHKTIDEILKHLSDYLCRVFGCNGGRNINQLFFAPFHENRHWMLAAISPWNGTDFWLDPAGPNNISEFAQRIINEGIIKFSTLYRKDIKKIKKNPMRWVNIQCPRQSQVSKDCGYFVCRYIMETIASRRPMIPEQYFPGALGTYAQEKIDEIRNIWVTYLFSQMEDEEIEDDDDTEGSEA